MEALVVVIRLRVFLWVQYHTTLLSLALHPHLSLFKIPHNRDELDDACLKLRRLTKLRHVSKDFFIPHLSWKIYESGVHIQVQRIVTLSSQAKSGPGDVRHASHRNIVQVAQ